MKASDFDRKFDAGHDITKLLDLTEAKRPGLEINGKELLMSYIQQNLTRDETIIAQARLHWVIFARPFFWLVVTLLWLIVGARYEVLQFRLLPIVPPVYKVLAGITLFATVISALLTYIAYFTTEFSITNKRMVMKTGLMHRVTREVLLNRIESISIDQSLMGRLFNYGALLVTGVGGSWDPLAPLPDPLHLRNTVQEQIEEIVESPASKGVVA